MRSWRASATTTSSPTGWRAWIAPESILPGEKWAPAINRGLEEGGVFVVALTPAAVKPSWVQTVFVDRALRW